MADQPGPNRSPDPGAASRRTFLLNLAAGAGAAGAAALAAGLPAVTTRPRAATPPDAAGDGPMHEGALVAYLRDARTGEISLLAGDREVVITDHALARTLARKAR